MVQSLWVSLVNHCVNIFRSRTGRLSAFWIRSPFQTAWTMALGGHLFLWGLGATGGLAFWWFVGLKEISSLITSAVVSWAFSRSELLTERKCTLFKSSWVTTGNNQQTVTHPLLGPGGFGAVRVAAVYFGWTTQGSGSGVCCWSSGSWRDSLALWFLRPLARNNTRRLMTHSASQLRRSWGQDWLSGVFRIGLHSHSMESSTRSVWKEKRWKAGRARSGKKTWMCLFHNYLGLLELPQMGPSPTCMVRWIEAHLVLGD